MVQRVIPPGDAELHDLLARDEPVHLVDASGRRHPLDRGQRDRLAAALRDDLLTTQQAADVLGVSRPTVVKLIDDGSIPSIRPGSHRRVRARDIAAFAQRERAGRRQALDELAALPDVPESDRGFLRTR